MKLYAFQPQGHGKLSFFVMSDSYDAAIQHIDTYIEKRRIPVTEDQLLDDVPREIGDYEIEGWGTNYYSCLELEEGEVVENAND